MDTKFVDTEIFKVLLGESLSLNLIQISNNHILNLNHQVRMFIKIRCSLKFIDSYLHKKLFLYSFPC